jgi:hypothetical protein
MCVLSILSDPSRRGGLRDVPETPGMDPRVSIAGVYGSWLPTARLLPSSALVPVRSSYEVASYECEIDPPHLPYRYLWNKGY